MVIGIDAREAAGPRAEQQVGAAGRARYVHELLQRLPRMSPETRFLLYTARDGSRPPLAANAEWRVIGAPGVRWHARAARLARRDCDVYFSTLSYLTPHLLPHHARYVQTVFDLIAFKDFALPHRRTSRIERLTIRRALRRARAIVAISHATARDLRELLPDLAPRVRVTPLAANDRFRADHSAEALASVRLKYGLPATFVLAAGTIEPRKNFTRLVEAYRALPRELRLTNPLVLAGKRGWEYEPVFRAIAAAQEGEIRHVDFVPDDDLARLCAAATVFCYPSLYEGFGLPVLEAMQAGAPVITAHVSSLPEVGGDAVRYVDPYDVTDIATALGELLTDEAKRRRLREAGLARAREFSWERTARETMEVLRAAA